MSDNTLKPHIWTPDYTFGMGDCAVCGHVKESPIHVEPGLPAPPVPAEVPTPPALYVYIASKPCGCVVGFMADLPDMRDQVAEMVADFIREGLTVDRVRKDDPRSHFDQCTHRPEVAHAH